MGQLMSAMGSSGGAASSAGSSAGAPSSSGSGALMSLAGKAGQQQDNGQTGSLQATSSGLNAQQDGERARQVLQALMNS